jgi:hypothetical protein
MYYDDRGELVIVRHKGMTPDIERALCEKVINGHLLAQAISAQ